jgi:cell division inhibitor SepF
MAGAMRRMGVYLGLVEDDDVRQYSGRYDARQGGHGHPDERHPDERRAARLRTGDGYDERYDERYDEAAGGYAEPAEGWVDRGEGYPERTGGWTDRARPAAESEPVARRVAPARPLGLAPSGPTAGPVRAGGASPAGATAAGLAVREGAVREPAVREVPAVAVAPEPAPAPQPYRITTLHPRTYNEARVIGERFRDGMPVIMNLTEMDDADAKRLVDFAAGLSFGLRGSIERVTAKVFLISPRDVDVTAEDKARIREGGFFNQS